MKYIIMCGGTYTTWEKPRQFSMVCGERVVARTIRLLRECGVEDIAISTNDDRFSEFGVPILKHTNGFRTDHKYCIGSWVDAFYPTSEPVCYLFGDVVFSPEAIRTIVKTETDDIAFFASAPPFSEWYVKKHAEPFAFKSVDTERFHGCIATVKYLKQRGAFGREPIAWELWQVIRDTPVNEIDFNNYVVINDYTCDIDAGRDAERIERAIHAYYDSCRTKEDVVR